MASVQPRSAPVTASATRPSWMRWAVLAASFIAMLSLPFISFGFGETSGPAPATPGEGPSKPASPSNHPAANSTRPSSQPDSAHASAQSLADYGKYQLDWDLPDEAVKQCQAALSKDPANKAAASCLENAAALKVDDALNSAADEILIHNRPSCCHGIQLGLLPRVPCAATPRPADSCRSSAAHGSQNMAGHPRLAAPGPDNRRRHSGLRVSCVPGPVGMERRAQPPWKGHLAVASPQRAIRVNRWRQGHR